MTAKELDKMVDKMREFGGTIDTRCRLENYIFLLDKGLRAAGKDELANQLLELNNEIDKVDTIELAKLGTFN